MQDSTAGEMVNTPTDQDGAPFYPPKYFDDKGITAEQLRQAKRQGHIRTRQPKPGVQRFQYSEPDAKGLWPHCFLGKPQSK